ncbi:MAG: hypothetical protein HQL73_03580 [Magnetococcales bacterium]|nr:hypothetical protein [Magnetococcales bacterium]
MRAESILSHLAPHISRIESKVSGKRPALGWEAVTAAMPKNRLQSLLVRVKWAGDGGAWQVLVVVAMKNLWPQEWKTQDPSRAQKLMELALREWNEPGICRRCGGREEDGRCVVRTRDKKHPFLTCPTCHGTGIRQARSGRQMAQIIGIDEKTWRDTWSRRYAAILAALNTLESNALATICKGLTDREAVQ